MAILNIKATFPCDIKKAWETLTSLDKFEWKRFKQNRDSEVY